MSTLGGITIQTVELHIPRWGGARARIETADGAVPVGPATLIVGNLSLVGNVVPERAGENAASSWVGIWESGFAWQTILVGRTAYQNDDGVQLKSILTDLARECGRVAIEQPTNRSVGAWWVRKRLGPDRKSRTGADELAELGRAGYLPGPWWADVDGTTRFGGRTAGAVTVEARLLGRDLDAGRREIGTESPAAFLPGGSYDGATIGRVVIRERNAELRVETWAR